MFARKPASAASVPAPAPGPDWLALARNPYLGAGAAALVLAAAAGVLVLAAGDPHAGAPSVRVALPAPSKADLGALRAPPPAATVIALDTLQNGQEVLAPASAQITLPSGASVSAGASALVPDAAPTGAPRPQSPPLPVAPLAGLTAPGPDGPLPVIAKDGRTPAQAYARPFHDSGKPKVALVIGGLGLNAASTKAAIERLPPEVTLSFVPYADDLQGWIDQARVNGHEVLLEIPMEPTDYPTNDPGPYTLMAAAPLGETTKRLDWLLSRASGYFGVANYLGARFIASDTAFNAFTATLRNRGLAFVDDGAAARRGAGPPRASADAVVDQQLSADAIAQALLQLEARALQHGAALGSGFAYPVTVEQAIRWAAGLPQRGYQLAPASAITRR